MTWAATFGVPVTNRPAPAAKAIGLGSKANGAWWPNQPTSRGARVAATSGRAYR